MSSTSLLQSNSTITPALDGIGKHLAMLKQQRDANDRQAESLQARLTQYDEEIEKIALRRRFTQEQVEQARSESARLNKTIVDAEATYAKLLETMQTLATLVRKEATDTTTKV